MLPPETTAVGSAHRRSPIHQWSRTLAAVAMLAGLVALPARAQQSGTISGTVTDAVTGEALQGASVAVVGTRSGNIAGSGGRYSITIAPGTYQLAARFIGYAPVTRSVTVAAGETVTADFKMKQSVASLSEVVVTGTRQPGRTAVDAPAPVDVFTAQQIQQTGLTETAQILEFLAPSFNFPRPSVTDGTDHIRPATLRGLAPDQVLVLINGKRRHTSSLVNINGSIGRGSMAVDLNAIPASAIDHIEVLRDGAAAQYGSDAIAGVINIILKSHAPGEISNELGQTGHDDGRTWDGNGVYSWNLPRDGYFMLSGEVRMRDSTNRAGPDLRQQYFTGDPRNSIAVLNNRVNSWVGDPNMKGGASMFNFGLPLANGMQLYAFGGFNYTNGIAAGFWRRALDDRTLRAYYPNGFLPDIESHIWDVSEATGLKGTSGGWNWDLSTEWGKNSFRYNVDNSVNVSMGYNSPTHFYAGTMSFDQWTSNLDVQRGFDVGWSTPLNVAWGLEFRRDHYGIAAGDSASWMNGGVPILDGPDSGKVASSGAQVFPGFQPGDITSVSRNNVAAYVDLESNPTEQLLVDIAGRAEHYSDFGSTFSGKLAMRYEPVKGYAIRGSISNGFRAPSLGQEYFSTTSTNFVVLNGTTQPFDIRTFPVTSGPARALGARPLKAETSHNYSLGFALQPAHNVSLTADWYHIGIDHRIELSGNFLGPQIAQLLADSGFTNISGGRFFTNAINTRTEGIDIVLETAFDLGTGGTLRLTGGFNHNHNHVTHVDSTPPQLAGFQQVLFDRVERGRIEVGQPQNNVRLNGDWEISRLGVNLTESRFGSVTGWASSPGAGDQTYSAKWLTDLALSYHFQPRVTFTLGGNNIFDVFPDKNNAANSFGGIFQYSGISPFGQNGSFYYVKLNFGI